ncbi:hypothetical protein [Parabacteroides sp.]
MLKELSTCILSVLLLSVTGCQDDLPDKQEGTEGKGTITLTFTAEPGRMVQTKSEVRPATPGSEADKAGFSYEMVVTTIDSISPETKAKPVSFKNAIALLFNGDTFNGRAEIGNFQGGVPLTATFTGVTTTNATNCRLVLVAHDNDASQDLITSNLSTYSSDYSTFCSPSKGPGVDAKLITKDADVPYVGSVTGVNLSDKSTAVSNIQLFRMLAKTTVTAQLLNTPDTMDCKVGIEYAYHANCIFGTVNEYNGTGTNTIANPVGSVAQYSTEKTHTFYGGEVVRPDLTATTLLERNKENVGDAPRVNILLNYQKKDPATAKVDIGKEFTNLTSFHFNVYLGSNGVSDFSIRRNHNYDVTVTLSGTQENFTTRSITDKRIRTFGESGGLCVGRFGGFVATASGSTLSDVKGYYTKMLLLEPNYSREIGVVDSKTYVWNTSPGSSAIQPDARRFWDYSYIESLSGQGGMSNVSGSPYYYCNSLTLGGVTAGTWYVPTVQQLSAIQTVLAGMKDDPAFGYYSGFDAQRYWSATENGAGNAWIVFFNNLDMSNYSKTYTYRVRCVRDL